MAGAIVAAAALDAPGRVASLTLVSTTPGDPELPPMSPGFLGYVGAGEPDPADPAAVVEYVVGLMRAYSGPSPYFDAAAMRAIAERDLARTRDVAACLTNHFAIDLDVDLRLGDLAVPTLVVHGELDPVFPLPHGEALRDAIPGARLLVLNEAGHELPPAVWDVVVPALAEHTAGD